ncbi:MAG: tetratricopeptide repeat protein [Pseudomonadota bacterium]
MMEQALEKHRAGDLAGAAADYRAILTETPDNDEAHHFLGLILLDQGDLNGALDEVEKALELKPDVATYYATLGSIRHAQGDPAAARANLAQALELNPNLPEGHNTLGFLELTLGDLEAAEKALNTALRLDPDSPRVQVNMGQVRLAQGQLDDAVTAFQRVLSMDPNNLPARTSLGEALLRKGAYATAEEAFRSALKQRPGIAGWQVGLARALLAQNRLAEGREICTEVLTAMPDNPQARATAGEVSLALNHLVDAVEHLKQSLLKRPGHRPTIELLGDALRATGELEQAAQCYSAAGTPDAQVKALALKMDSGDLAGARSGLEALLRDDPANATVALVLADAQEEPVAAVSVLETFVASAAEDHPQRDAVLLAPAAAALEAQDPDRVLEALDAINTTGLTDPQAAQSRELWGRAMDLQGNYREAAKAFQAVTRQLNVEQLALPLDDAPAAAEAPDDDGHEPPVFLLGLPGSGARWLASVLRQIPALDVLEDRFSEPGERRDLLDSNVAKRLGKRPAESHHRLERRAYWRAAERQRRPLEGRVLAVDALPLAQCRLDSLRAFFPGSRVLLAHRHPADELLHARTWGWREGLLSLETLLEFYERVLAGSGIEVIAVDVDQVIEGVRLETTLAPLAAAYTIDLAGLDRAAAAGRDHFNRQHYPAGHWQNYRENLALHGPQLTALADQLGYKP